jgi:outer membrane biogenesis lipoprotein LolB
MIRIHRGLAVCLLIAFSYLAASCTVKPVPPAHILQPEQPAAAAYAWSLFQATFSPSCPTKDFSARGSVNYISGDRTARVLFSFWGRTQFPVRMDLQTGMGTMLAHWREDAQGFLSYHPGNAEAFVSSDSRVGAETMGLTMPLRLDALAQILTGCWGRIVPREYVSARFTGRHFDYALGGEAKGIVLSLSADGRPEILRREGPGGWELVIEEWFDGHLSLSPRRLRLTQGQNVAIVRLQRLDIMNVSWQETDLFLDLPFGTSLWKLE